MSKGIAPELFEHEMITNTRVLGRETGVKVVIGGDKAMTDGKTVILPAVPKDKDVSNQSASIARGFVNHEAAHNRYSNMATLKRFAKHPDHAAILGGMEDGRIEKRFSDEYPGARSHFEATANAAAAMFNKQVKSGEVDLKNKKALLPIAASWKGRELGGQVLDEKVMKEFWENLGPDVEKAATEMASAALACNRTVEVGRVVEKWLGKITPETPEEQEGEDGPGKGGGSPGEGEDEEKGDNPMAGFGPGAIHDGPRPDLANAVSQALGAGEPTGDRYFSDLAQDNIYDDFEQYTNECSNKTARWSEEEIGRRSIESLSQDMSAKHLRAQGLAVVKLMRDGLGTATRAVKMALERGLIVAKEDKWDSGHLVGSIDAKLLASFAAGNREIYRKKVDDNLVDTAVTLLIDMSGSMANDKSIEAMKAAYVFAESLDKVGVPVEVLGFHSDRVNVNDPHGMLTRMGKIEMPVYKAFDDHMRTCMWRIGLIAAATQCAHGCDNADGDSVLHAWFRLRKRSEPRKVMIVFSDGHPATRLRAGKSMDLEYGNLRSAVQKVTNDGIDIIGVGIMDRAVKEFYPQHILIDRAEQLPVKAGALLKDLLLPSRIKKLNARKLAA